MQHERADPGTLTGIVLIALFLIPVLVYWPTAADVFEIWMRSDTFAHGVIVFPLAVYLLFERRGQVRGLKARGSPAGLVALVLICTGWYLASLAGMAVLQQLSLAMMMVTVVLMVLGASIARQLAFPLLFVFFSVPIGEFLIGPLMSWTAEFTVFALKLTGIPVFREGMFFKIPSGNFEVAKACSGIRYLIASVALGSLYANMFLRTRWRQVLFVGVAILLPIVANGFRAYGIVMIAHLSDMKLAVGVDHIIYGWLFFGVVMFVMFSFGWRLRAGEPELAETPQRNAASAGSGQDWNWRSIAVGATVALLIMAAPRVLQFVSEIPANSPATAAAPLPAAAGGWQGPLPVAEGSPVPAFVGAAASGIGQYRRGADAVTLFVATYDAKNRATEMVTWQNQFYAEPWKVMSVGKHRIMLGERRVSIREALLTSRGRRYLVWHWYETDSMVSGSDVLGKLAETVAALPFRSDRPRAISMATPINQEAGRSREVLSGFLRDYYSRLEQCLHLLPDTARGDDGASAEAAGCQSMAGR